MKQLMILKGTTINRRYDMNIILILICSCLLFGADATKKGLGCLFKSVLMLFIVLLVIGYMAA